MKKKLVVIAGPTGSGKTALAIQLAQSLETEIVSADSRQVFKEMKIGTAQPSPEELMLAPHHLVGHRSIFKDYNASIFAEEANKAIESIFQKKDVAILCGGSGLYIRAVLEGLDELPEVSSEIRRSLQKEYEVNGLDWLQKQAQVADQKWFVQADPQNHRRLLRCVEIYRASGKKLSELQQSNKPIPDWEVIKIGLDLPREQLYDRINSRVDTMIKTGLIEEATLLYPHQELSALHTVGYTELFCHFRKEITLEEAINQIKQHSRNYAKRQMTWFRREEDIVWLDPQKSGCVSEILRRTQHSPINEK